MQGLSHKFRSLGHSPVSLDYKPSQKILTHKTHQTTHATRRTIPSSHLGLDEKLHDSHSSTINHILLVAWSSSARLIEQLRSLSHSETDKFRLGASTTTTTTVTRSEALKGLGCWSYLHHFKKKADHKLTCNAAAPPISWALKPLAPPWLYALSWASCALSSSISPC